MEQSPPKKRHLHPRQEDVSLTTGKPSSSRHGNGDADFSTLVFKPPSQSDRYTVGDFEVSQAFYELQLDLVKRKQKFLLESDLHDILAVSSILLVKPGKMPEGVTRRFGQQKLNATIKDLYSKIDTTDQKNSRLPLSLINELITVVEDAKLGIKSRNQGTRCLLAMADSLAGNEFKIVNSVVNMISKLPYVAPAEVTKENELCTRYLDPLLAGLFDDPTNNVFFRWTDQVNLESQKSSSLSKSRPDSCITKANEASWSHSLGFGEVKCAGEGDNMHSISKDLCRLGTFSKNAIDVGNMTGVITFQAVGRSITFYLTTLLKDGLYVMVELAHIQAPGCIDDILFYLMRFNKVLLVLDVYDVWCCPLAPSEIATQKQRSRPGMSSAAFSRLVSPTMRRSRPSVLKLYNN